MAGRKIGPALGKNIFLPALMSGHIFTIGFSYGNERGSKKDKKGQNRQKPEIPAFLPFLLRSRLSLQDLTL
jgi:hypothetical protein